MINNIHLPTMDAIHISFKLNEQKSSFGDNNNVTKKYTAL